MLKSSTIWLGLFASIATFLIVLMGYLGLFKLMLMFLIMSIVLWTVFAEEVRIEKRDKALSECNVKLSKCKK
jgi:hypothetical protein